MHWGRVGHMIITISTYRSNIVMIWHVINLFIFYFLSLSSRDPTRILRSCPSSSLMHKGWNCLRWGGWGFPWPTFLLDPLAGLLHRLLEYWLPWHKVPGALPEAWDWSTKDWPMFEGQEGAIIPLIDTFQNWSVPKFKSVFCFVYRCHQSHSHLWMLAPKRAWVRSRFCWQALTN